MSVTTLAELVAWLTAVHIPTHTWGQNGTKSVDALWHELLTGDAQLQNSPPQRLVQVVQIVIQQNGRLLIEAAQELADGQIRQRNLLPAEKMKRGEQVETAVFRGLHEELGVSASAITILPHSYQHHQLLQNSPSYPGLPTHYTIHRLAVQVAGLPTENFWRDNLAHGHGDPIKHHLWAWQLENEVHHHSLARR